MSEFKVLHRRADCGLRFPTTLAQIPMGASNSYPALMQSGVFNVPCQLSAAEFGLADDCLTTDRKFDFARTTDYTMEETGGSTGKRGVEGGRRGRRPWPLSDNARYPGTVKIEYPLHPLFGQEVRAVPLDGKGREGQLLVENVDDRCCVPAWMADSARCALLTFGWQPFASSQALRQLEELLASLDR